jgi:hypothetical protein
MDLVIPKDMATQINSLGLKNDDLIYIIKLYIKQLSKIDEYRKRTICSSSDDDSSSDEEISPTVNENENEKMIESIHSVIKKELKSIVSKNKDYFNSLDKSIATVRHDELTYHKEQNTHMHNTRADIKELSSHFSKGTLKGPIAEQNIEFVLCKLMPYIEITDNSKKGHQMDRRLNIEDVSILLEIKNHSTNVSINDIKKFKSDMKTNSEIKYFILYSIKSGIANVKDTISFGNSGNQLYIYISNGGMECISLFFAVKFICMIDEYSKKTEFDCSNLEKLQVFINQEFEQLQKLKELYDVTYMSQCVFIDKQLVSFTKQKKEIVNYHTDFMKEIDNSIMKFDRYINSGEIKIDIHVTKSRPDLNGMNMNELKQLLKDNNVQFKTNLSKSGLKDLVSEHL